jgi:hypothetical protein
MEHKPSQIEISHKCKGAFRSWNIRERCENSSYEYSHALVFDKDMFELYENKKVQTQTGSFPTHDAKNYVFKLIGQSETLSLDEELKTI